MPLEGKTMPLDKAHSCQRGTPVRPETLFLVFALIFGAACMIITPPFQVPDEFGHFCRAYQLSEGVLKPQIHDGEAGGYIHESLIFTISRTSQKIEKIYKNKQDIDKLILGFDIPLNSRRVFMGFSYQAQLSPASYAASAAVMAAARAAGAGPLMLMYLGRAANLCVWIALVYLSIRVTPVFKWLFTLLALTPMSLFQSASLSADSFTNASAFIFIAFVFRYALDEEFLVGVGGAIFLSVLAVAFSLSKTVYVAALPVFFIIPPRKFQSGGVRLFAALLLFISSAASIFIWSYNSVGFAVFESTPGNIHPMLQLKYIFTHPLDYAFILAGSLAGDFKELVYQFIGHLGWLDVKLPWPLRKSYLAVLFAVAVVESGGGIILNRRQKSIILFSVIVCTAALFTSQYVTWTPYMDKFIKGPQGRYFIPLSPLIFSLLHNRRKFLDIDGKPFIRFVCYFLLICWLWVVLLLVKRYYAV
jgi:uncharacterized membrane protein